MVSIKELASKFESGGPAPTPSKSSSAEMAAAAKVAAAVRARKAAAALSPPMYCEPPGPSSGRRCPGANTDDDLWVHTVKPQQEAVTRAGGNTSDDLGEHTPRVHTEGMDRRPAVMEGGEGRGGGDNSQAADTRETLPPRSHPAALSLPNVSPRSEPEASPSSRPPSLMPIQQGTFAAMDFNTTPPPTPPPPPLETCAETPPRPRRNTSPGARPPQPPSVRLVPIVLVAADAGAVASSPPPPAEAPLESTATRSGWCCFGFVSSKRI